MTFDLEKARAALEEAIDRMSLAVRDEDGDVWEADPEQAEILQAILDRTEIAENHRCLELQYQLDSAEAEIERLRGEMENYGDDYVCQMNSKDVRIQELEDALVEERARALWFEGDDPCDPPNLDWKTEPNDIPESVRLLWGESARRQLQAEGKIGPDADAKLHCWQITEEREEAFGRILRRLEYDQSLPGHTNYKIQRAMELLRAMLEEAGL